MYTFCNTAPPAPPFFLGYTPGGAAAPLAPLLTAVMYVTHNNLKGIHIMVKMFANV